MNINSIIKPESREEFKQPYRDNEKFILVSGGKLGRKILRNLARKEIKRQKGQLQSDLGKMKSRQERKSMAKALGVKFTPRYNGVTLKLKHTEYTNDKGYTKYTSYLEEVK